MTRWLVGSTAVVTGVRVVAAAIVLLVVGMPLWEAWGFGDAVRTAFAPYCHQRFDRSFAVAGVVLPLCARCTGLWLGALGGALLLPLVRSPRAIPRLRVLAWAAVPMALDLAAEHAAGLGPHAVSRALTGMCLGAAIVGFVIPALVRAGEEIQGRCETGSSISRA